jgi:DNA-binding NtrC family response regulator
VETVLLADDEAMLRRLVRRVLENRGFRVIEAGDGREAVDRFREHLDDIALVLLDVAMPQLGGLAALAQIRALDPGVPAILMSGLLEAEESALSEAHTEFLQKPYALDDVVWTIRKLVDEAAPTSSQRRRLTTESQRTQR